MMSQDTELAPAAQPKYSRYRSVRNAAAAAKQTLAEPAPADQKNEVPSRSMSRYRRPRAASKADQATSPPLTAVPAVPALPPEQSSAAAFTHPIRRATEPATTSTHAQPARNNSERRWAPQAAGQTDEQRRGAQRAHDYEQRLQAQAVEEKLAEQKRKDLERLEATLDAATVSSPVKEKFGFFSRKRTQTKTTAPPPPPPAAPAPPTSAAGPSSSSISRTVSNDAPRRSNEPSLPRTGTVVVPGADAPISAVNAGERRVLVRHKQSSVSIPINPGTTALDIFYSSANLMTHNIAPAATVLLESYTQLGLERRVRRYEHIRDILNSWDRDTQNALILQNSDSPKFDTDLESASVPKDPPADVTVYMYHSQKPSRWHKCYITLLSSGQMFMSKKANAKASDKDISNLCHLSDFDIYTPVASQLRKLRAPKKHCYAVKSQQKTTMFLSTENFVHFFSTDDELLANRWYGAVQRWRSWYLVHRMGAGSETAKRGKKPAGPTTAIPGARAPPTQGAENPYLIGSFQPLYSGDAAPAADGYDSEDENRPLQIPFHLRNSRPVSSPSRNDSNSSRHPPPVAYRLPADAEEEFASSGLLGRSYSQRLRAQKEREVPPPPPVPTTHRRSMSTRSRPDPAKPLLDFTPQFKEAPQWDRTGKGHGVAAPEGVPLVQVATTLETPAVGMPRTTLFSRRKDGRP